VFECHRARLIERGLLPRSGSLAVAGVQNVLGGE